MAGYEKGQRVMYDAYPSSYDVEVQYGPYGADLKYYIVRDVNTPEDEFEVPGTSLSPKPTDPRREVVAKAMHAQDDDGRAWWEISDEGRDLYLADADAILAALDALNSDSAPARYADRHGDTWEDRPNARLTLVDVSDKWMTSELLADPEYTELFFDKVEQLYGPLNRLP